MVTANDIGDGHVRFDSARHTTEDAYRDGITNKSRPRLGDILVTKDGTLGRVAVCEGTRLCINQSVALLRIREQVASIDFLQNALRAWAYQNQMVLDAGGTTIKHIYITRLVKMRAAFPPRDEQHAICAFVNERRRELDSLLGRVSNAIDKLREYRSALISAAVTGKIDVREVVM